MSIIKRKAGSEDIVKSVLEFDAVPTDGSPNLVESGAVAQAIGNLGQPLQWKGPATVYELETGIEDIQPGWTYTLTDAGTLTRGAVKVDVGDEVAWTANGEWFKLGGEGGIKVLHGSSNPGGTTYPTDKDVIDAVDQDKDVIILWNSSDNLYIYRLVYVFGYGSSGDKEYHFRCLQDQNELKKLSVSGGVGTWSRAVVNGIAHPISIANTYSDSSTYVVGDYCTFGGLMYKCAIAVTTPEPFDITKWSVTSVAAQIGNVEALLAAL